MRICCISDIHGHLPDLPDSDLVIIAGDILPFVQGGRNYYLNQMTWLNSIFRTWLEKISVPVVAIAGNHDEIFDFRPDMVPELPWIYLQNNQKEINELKIWGSPWSLYFGDWAFMQGEDFLNDVYSVIPENIDVLISHIPPYGCADLVERVENDKKILEHCGSVSLVNHLRRIRPKVIVCGHLHANYGVFDLNGTKVINATIMDEEMKPTRKPIIFDLD